MVLLSVRATGNGLVGGLRHVELNWNKVGHHLPGLVVEWAVVFVISGKSILVILFTKGPMKAGMLLMVRRESEGVLGILRMFGNDFGIGDMGGGSFVTVDHLCSELVGVLRLFIYISSG